MTQLVPMTPTEARRILTKMVAHPSDPLPDTVKTVFVGRGRGKQGKWANPFSYEKHATAVWHVEPATPEACKRAFEEWFLHDPAAEQLRVDARTELRGKVLLTHEQHQDQSEPPCHAEVLVRYANPGLAAAERQLQAAPRHRDLNSAAEFTGWLIENEKQEAPRFLICGSREFADKALVARVIDRLPANAVVVEGEAKGADSIAADLALERNLSVAGFPARWGFTTDKSKAHRFERPKQSKRGAWYDAAAGARRNENMVKTQPQECWVFDPGPGSMDMAMRAFNRGIPVFIVDQDGNAQKHVLNQTPPPEQKGMGVPCLL